MTAITPGPGTPKEHANPTRPVWSVLALADRLGVAVPTLYQIAKNVGASYWKREAKIGRKFRVLRTSTGDLRRVQDTLHDTVLRQLPRTDAAQCAPGRGVIAHARAHLGQAYVTVLDFADCFPSVRVATLTEALQTAGFDRPAAALVTRLCTVDGELPQGAPTSSALLSTWSSRHSTAR